MATTPVESFARNAQTSGSGYDAKLQALVGIGRAVKGSQVARRQMQDQLEQQKELIQFRADTELERQVEYNKRITQPQQQARAQATAQQKQTEAILQSREAAQERRQELMDEYHDNFGNLRKYNLMTPYFDVRQNQETGLFEAKVFDTSGGELTEVDPQQYRYQAETLNEQAQWFQRLEEGLDEGWFPESIPEAEKTKVVDGRTVERLSADNVRDILNTSNDPETAKMYLRQKDSFDYPSPYETQAEGQGTPQGRGGSGQFSTAPNFAQIKSMVDENGIVKFAYAENPNLLQRLGQATGITTPSETKRSFVNLGGMNSVEDIMEQVNGTAQDIFGFDLSPLNRYEDSIRKQILAGDDEGLSGDEEDLANKIGNLRSDEQVSKQLDQLFTLYFNLPAVANEWRTKFSPAPLSGTPNKSLYPNFNNYTGFSNIFTEPSEDVTAVKTYTQQAVQR